MPYHLVVTLLDRSSPNAARSILRGSSSARSAGRTPHQTATGLPGPLDLETSNAPSYFPASGFWEDLAAAPTTRLGERWDQLEERQVGSPRVEWTEPDSVKASARGGFTPAPTLDYRFGPISLDWIDRPDRHPVFASSPTSPTSPSMGLTPEASTSAAPIAGPSRSQMPSRQPSSHGVTSPSQPIAVFVPSSGPYQLGTTDLGYGSVHLYRDARDAEREAELHRWRHVGSQTEAFDKQKDATSASEDGTVVGILAIPSYMTASDFLAFVAPAVEAIESIRILRDAMPHRAFGLVKFRQAADATTFARDFDGRPFSHLQDREICHIARIASIEVKSSLIPPFSFPALLPPDQLSQSAIELPTCPVCLERMDSTVTGLMTITCSHTFHCNCLSKWGDSRCPVCRYSQTRLRSNTATLADASSRQQDPSECAACGSEANLWICLICGHVGCGRYQGGHAHRHFEETAHTYALELGSQRVWDYVGDGYVHRLIQTKNDEIVELPALSSAVFDAGGGPGRDAVAQQAKIEAIGEEFGSLVASQLDSQRAYYEKELRFLHEDLDLARAVGEQGGEFRVKYEDERARREGLEAKIGTLKAEAEKTKAEVKRLLLIEGEVVPGLEKERARLEKKVDKALELARRFEKELGAERAMGQGLQAKVGKLEAQRREGDEKTGALEGQVKDLNEQLRDLMFFIDARAKVESEGGEDLQGGAVSLPLQGQSPKTRRKKK